MTKEIRVIKSLLKRSIKNNNIETHSYIHKLLIDHVYGINKSYTYVCFLIKLFLLDCEANYASENIIYHFDGSFIKYCFKLARNNKIQLDDSNLENDTIDDVNDDNNNVESVKNLNGNNNETTNDQNKISKRSQKCIFNFLCKI